MKKPIDPNLNSNNDDDFFVNVAGTSQNKKKDGDLSFADDFEIKKPSEPNFTVTVNDNGKNESSAADSSETRDPVDDVINKIVEKAKIQHGLDDEDNTDNADNKEKSSESAHHHHSSGSSHHHHSSGSSHHHHSSGSSHHHHHHSSSHHSSKKKKKKLPIAAKIAIIVLAILLIMVIVFVGTFSYLRYVGKKDVMPVITEDVEYQEVIEYNGHTYKFNEDVFSVAFIGVDQRDLETVDETDFVGAADADIVVAVDTKTGESSVIAIPRDTMVDIDMYSPSRIFLRTERAQLCLAYSYGDGGSQSCTNSINAMSRILYNVPIQKYYALNLDGIAPLNDAIGGVTVESLYDFNDLGISVGDKVTLKGDMAEAYVRTRSLDNINASLNRTDRQIQYVKAYAQQVVPAVMKNFSVVASLYSTASDFSQTNLSLSNATYIASLLLSKGVTDFNTYTLKGEMTASEDPILEDVVHAEFTPDEDYLMQTVLDVFYTQID